MGFKFEQLDGPKKTLELKSHYGPHGRPRHGAVVRDAVTLRESEVYYFGNDVPTRHVAGVRHDPWELKGRFSDYWGGPGFAQNKTGEVKSFVLDMQTVRITWDDILNVTGLITEFDPGRESDGETEWRMVIRIDSDNFQFSNVTPATHSPFDVHEKLILAEREIKLMMAMPLQGSVFEAFDSLVAAIGSATASLAAIASSMESFEESSIALLRGFRGALGQVKTAVLRFRNAIDSFTVDVAIESKNADDRLSWESLRCSLSGTLQQIVAEAAVADRKALLAERGQIKTLYTARGGDTWESISTREFGNAARAADIRAANSIPSGQAPQVGAVYQIPA